MLEPPTATRHFSPTNGVTMDVTPIVKTTECVCVTPEPVYDPPEPEIGVAGGWWCEGCGGQLTDWGDL